MFWQTTHYRIDLTQPRVMGIVNLTPDSFSDGGDYYQPGGGIAAAMRQCERLVHDGADMLDLGAESSRPGALPLPQEEELARLLPVLQEAVKLGVPISVDTYKPQVMQAALDAGADVINDIWALRQPGAAALVAAHPSCGVCLMHMHRDPQTMQTLPMTGDAVPQVLLFLKQQVQYIKGLGVDSSRICLDPGIGFGKTMVQNFALLAHQTQLLTLGHPLLLGWSRKSSLAAAINPSLSSAAALAANDRMVPSVAAALLAVERGARVLRVHDVRETLQVLKVWQAMQNAAQV
ncbi:MAG: dihydropteroate synthase [Burkholderiaceae bacterium]